MQKNMHFLNIWLFLTKNIVREKNMDQEKITPYLNAIYQNAKTGMQSISDIITKVKDEKFKVELAKEEDEYSVLAKECENFAKAEKI